jgi:tryptophan synthase beta chain
VSDASRSNEFLLLLNESLAFAPLRGDLWMRRFEVMKTLGFKREFADAVKQAMAQPEVSRQLDWNALQDYWQEIAASEPFPAHVATPRPAFRPTATGAFKRARFSDIATRIAGAELAVLAKAYNDLVLQPEFFANFARMTSPLLKRPTPLEFSPKLSEAAGAGARIYLKREDRRSVPAETEHAAAQCYIGSQLGKTHIVTGNDVDEHSLAVAEVAPFFKQRCTIVVRPDDLRNKRVLIGKLKQLGATIETMPDTGMVGTDPREGALRIWQKTSGNSHLVLSLGMAPPPHTAMANNFQALLGRETETQYHELASMFERPLTLVAAVGSEADSIGFVLPFLKHSNVKVVYVEPEPGGIASWRPSQRLRHYHGQIREHSWLLGAGRIHHVPVPDGLAQPWRSKLVSEHLLLSLEDARALAMTAMLGQTEPAARDYIVLIGRFSAS